MENKGKIFLSLEKVRKFIDREMPEEFSFEDFRKFIYENIEELKS